MNEILEKKHYRKIFYSVVGITLLLILIIRGFVIPYFDECLEISFLDAIVFILDGLFSSLIVAILVGSFIFWLTPKVVKKSMMEIVAPKEISPLLREATHTSKSWKFKGGSGRYTRAVTLPLMADAARKESIGRDIRICIMNPKNEELCEEYSIYRKSLKSYDRSNPWSIERIRNEIVSTIVSSLITQHDEPLLTIEIHLLDHFSAFRYDISDKYIVITKEDKEASALKADSNTYFYDSYVDEIRLHERQGKKIEKPKKRFFLERDKFKNESLKTFIKELNILSNEEIDTLDLKVILDHIQNPKDPYS